MPSDPADEIPVALQTPFRAALVRSNTRVVAVSVTKTTMTVHLIRDFRALCGMKNPKGEKSDMTFYAVEQIVCKRCMRSFGAFTVEDSTHAK